MMHQGKATMLYTVMRLNESADSCCKVLANRGTVRATFSGEYYLVPGTCSQFTEMIT